MLCLYFSVVALDLRGYNETDKPSGISNYELELLAKDVGEAIEKLGGKAILIGHDWGAAISWVLAMTRVRPIVVSSAVIYLI